MAGAFYGYNSIDRRAIIQLERWDYGEISLRGALLYILGLSLADNVFDMDLDAGPAAKRGKTGGAFSSQSKAADIDDADMAEIRALLAGDAADGFHQAASF